MTARLPASWAIGILRKLCEVFSVYRMVPIVTDHNYDCPVGVLLLFALVAVCPYFVPFLVFSEVLDGDAVRSVTNERKGNAPKVRVRVCGICA